MSDLAVGSTLGGYRIDGVIGQGGMGVVYRATQLRLDRTVALKVIMPSLARDPGFRDRFASEARLAASIDHHNVVTVHEAGEEDGLLYLVMRYIDGQDLRTLIATTGRLDPGRAARIMVQIGSALDAAHRRGLVHRDVKPANILIVAEGGEDHAYLTDFGLTKHVAAQGLTRTGEFVGTVDYAAPEQITGLAFDARTDVYALGCVLYEALTGEVPYVRDSDVAKIYAHLHDPPRRVSETVPVPAALDAVVQRAMAKDPDERFPSAGDFGRASVAATAGHAGDAPERSVGVGAAAPASSTHPSPVARHGPAPETDVSPVRGAPEPVVAATEAKVTHVAAPRGGVPKWPAVVVALVLAAVAGVIAVTGGAEKPATDLVRPDATATVPATATASRSGGGAPRVTDSIPVGDTPDGITVGDGAVWVLTAQDGDLHRIDPQTRDVTDTVPAGVLPDSVIADDGAVYVTAEGGGGTLLRFATRPKLRQTAAVVVGPKPESMAFGTRSLWVVVSDADVVRKADRATGELTAEGFPVGDAPIGIDVRDDRLWVANSGDGTVTLRRRGSTVTVPVGRNPRTVVEAFGFAWVVLTDENAVVRLDPASGDRVGPRIPVGGGPHKIAAGEGALWVTNSQDGTISQINPRTSKAVATIRVGARPLGIAAGEGAVWVGNADSGTVSRIEPGVELAPDS